MNKELQSSIEEILKNELVDRHSLFQLQFFVIGKEPTIQSKLWRCIREISARKESIDSLNLEIEELNDNILLLDIDSKDIDKNYFNESEIESDTKRKEIGKRQFARKRISLQIKIETLKKKLKYIEEEVQFFINAYKAISSTEQMKPFDDENSQLEYWNEKLAQEMGLRGLLGQPLDIELVRTILSLDEQAPIKRKTLEMLDKIRKKSIEDQLKKISKQ